MRIVGGFFLLFGGFTCSFALSAFLLELPAARIAAIGAVLVGLGFWLIVKDDE